jgi:hypothetical protein
VVISDGKSENAQRTIALDPFTLAALKALVDQLDQEQCRLVKAEAVASRGIGRVRRA